MFVFCFSVILYYLPEARPGIFLSSYRSTIPIIPMVFAKISLHKSCLDIYEHNKNTIQFSEAVRTLCANTSAMHLYLYRFHS